MMKKLLALLLVLTALSAIALAEFDLSQTIAVVSREEGSGTRGAFIELTGVQKKNDEGKDQDYTYAEADFVNGTSLVITTVSTNPAAIGYASLSSVLLNDTVKSIRIDGVEPTGLPPVFVPTSELVKTVSWHLESFLGLATS